MADNNINGDPNVNITAEEDIVLNAGGDIQSKARDTIFMQVDDRDSDGRDTQLYLNTENVSGQSRIDPNIVYNHGASGHRSGFIANNYIVENYIRPSSTNADDGVGIAVHQKRNDDSGTWTENVPDGAVAYTYTSQDSDTSWVMKPYIATEGMNLITKSYLEDQDSLIIKSEGDNGGMLWMDNNDARLRTVINADMDYGNTRTTGYIASVDTETVAGKGIIGMQLRPSSPTATDGYGLTVTQTSIDGVVDDGISAVNFTAVGRDSDKDWKSNAFTATQPAHVITKSFLEDQSTDTLRSSVNVRPSWTSINTTRTDKTLTNSDYVSKGFYTGYDSTWNWAAPDSDNGVGYTIINTTELRNDPNYANVTGLAAYKVEASTDSDVRWNYTPFLASEDEHLITKKYLDNVPGFPALSNEIFLEIFDNVERWGWTTPYKVGDIVHYSVGDFAGIYKCIQDHNYGGSDRRPGFGGDWQSYWEVVFGTPPGSVAGFFETHDRYGTYRNGSMVQTQDGTYVCKVAQITPVYSDLPNNWGPRDDNEGSRIIPSFYDSDSSSTIPETVVWEKLPAVRYKGSF